MYIKKGKNGGCRTEASLLSVATLQILKDRAYQKSNSKLLAGIVRNFDNNNPRYSWLLAGWLAEERRVPSGRLYRVKPWIIYTCIHTKLYVISFPIYMHIDFIDLWVLFCQANDISMLFAFLKYNNSSEKYLENGEKQIVFYHFYPIRCGWVQILILD